MLSTSPYGITLCEVLSLYGYLTHRFQSHSGKYVRLISGVEALTERPGNKRTIESVRLISLRLDFILRVL